MYATSQRVKSTQGHDAGQNPMIGINSFLHMHAGVAGSDVDWEKIKVEQVAEHPPGSPLQSSIEIPPGQNQVLSYLDVICPDTTSVEQIGAVITAAREVLNSSSLPMTFELDTVIVRFGAITGLEAASGLEYEALAERVMRIRTQAS